MRKGSNYIFFLVFAGIMCVMLSMGQSSINNRPALNFQSTRIEEKMPRIKTIKTIKPVPKMYYMFVI